MYKNGLIRLANIHFTNRFSHVCELLLTAIITMTTECLRSWSSDRLRTCCFTYFIMYLANSMAPPCQVTSLNMPILADHTCNKTHILTCDLYHHGSAIVKKGLDRQTAPIQMKQLILSHLIRIHTACHSQHTNPQHKRSERRMDGRLEILHPFQQYFSHNRMVGE